MESSGLRDEAGRRRGRSFFIFFLLIAALAAILPLPLSAQVTPLEVSIDSELEQHVDYGDRVTLRGSATGGSGTKSYSWTQTGGSATVTLSGANRASASFTAPTQSGDEWMGFQLTVTDASGTATSQTTYVDVFGTDSELSAYAGRDRTVGIGDTVSLSGSSWGRGGTRTFSWSQTSGSPTVTLSNATQAGASFTAPTVTSNTELEFTLSVTARSSRVGTSSATDTVRITVSPSPLEVDAETASWSVESGTSVTLDGTVTGGSGTLTYAWTQTYGPTVTLTDANRVDASFTTPVVASNSWLGFKLTVTSGDGQSDTATVWLQVTPATGPVALSVAAGTDQTVEGGETVTLSGSATGGSGTKGYTWTQTGGSPTVTISNASQASASFMAPTVTASTTLTFTLTATAGSETATDTVSVTVTPPALSAEAGAAQTVEGGETVTLSGSAAGGEGTKSYTWTQTGGSPTVTIGDASQASASFTAPTVTASITLTFTLTATDTSGSATDTVTVTVTPPPLGVEAGAAQMAAPGAVVTLSGTTTGGKGTKSYAWTQTGGSPTVTIRDASQASASFTAPTVTARTVLTFKLTATAGSETSTDTVDVTVVESALSAEAGEAQTVASRASVTLSGSATGGGGTRSYAWTQTGGSPTVILSDANQASASFTAPSVTVATELAFTLTVTDATGSATDTVAVTVSAGPPEVTAVSLVSRPQSGDTYRQGETIRAQVWLSGLAVVTGSPQLALGVGTQTRTMSYVSLDRARVLEFDYTVQATDTDTDGVSIGGTALSLPSGTTLAGESGGTVVLSLSGHAIANDSEHKVDGSQSVASPLPDLNACPGD